MYTVKEIFYTLQGEGANAGRAAVFCRFAGCNLWTGREADRAGAVCSFCDTDFVGVGPDGGKFATAEQLAAAVASRWPREERERRLVVCTGGEPLLQLDLPGIPKVKSGKVREMFDLGDRFLLVASDRISAFDCVMPNGIPRKGEVLTQLSHFWFERFASLLPNHLLAKALGLNHQLTIRHFLSHSLRRSMTSYQRRRRRMPLQTH